MSAGPRPFRSFACGPVQQRFIIPILARMDPNDLRKLFQRQVVSLIIGCNGGIGLCSNRPRMDETNGQVIQEGVREKSARGLRSVSHVRPDSVPVPSLTANYLVLVHRPGRAQITVVLK